MKPRSRAVMKTGKGQKIGGAAIREVARRSDSVAFTVALSLAIQEKVLLLRW